MEAGRVRKIELATDKEMPIVIQDYININVWEKLTSSIDKILAQWKLTNSSAKSPPSNKLTQTLLYEKKQLQLIYVSNPKITTIKPDEPYAGIAKYYSEPHCELLLPEQFPSHDAESTEISLWFGIGRYLCIELKESSSLSYIEPKYARKILSALQIALQHSK